MASSQAKQTDTWLDKAEPEMLETKDPDWGYECDRCGHTIRYKNEFVRHITGQGIRPGFRVIETHIAGAPVPFWLAEDDEVGEYDGLLHQLAPGQLAHSAIKEPCKSKLKQAREDKNNEQKVAWCPRRRQGAATST